MCGKKLAPLEAALCINWIRESFHMPVKMIIICICTCCLEEKKGSDFGQRYLGQRKVNSFKSIIVFLILVFSTTIKVKAGNICLRTLSLDLIIVSFCLVSGGVGAGPSPTGNTWI